MHPSRRVVVGLLVGFAGAIGLRAQQSGSQALVQRLAGDDAAAVAHAAAEAREQRDPAITRALQSSLRRWAEPKHAQAEYVRLLLLDALIAHEAKVPGDLLAPMLREPRTEIAALILMCREPRANEAQLMEELRRRGVANEVIVRAIGSVLVEAPSPAFVALALELAELGGELRVHAGEIEWRRVGKVMPARPGPPLDHPDGFPLLPRYELADRFGTVSMGFDGDDPVAHGKPVITPLGSPDARVGYSRVATPAEAAVGVPVPIWVEHRDKPLAIGWLHRIVGAAEARSLLFVHYRTDEHYLGEAIAKRAAWREDRERLFAGLVERGLLAPERVPALRRRCAFVVVDEREDPQKPLPELPPEALPAPAPRDR